MSMEETKKPDKNNNKIDLSIKVYKDDRQGIYERPLMKAHIIPSFGNMIVCGGTNAGKSQVVLNMLKRPEMMGKINGKHYYDIIYLFCFSASQLLANHLKEVLEPKRIIKTPDAAILQKIIDTQTKMIEDKGYERSPMILIIFDDIISQPKFARSNAIATLFYQGTNAKMSTMFLTQNYMDTKRGFRTNAHYNLLFCNGMTDTELERICLEHRIKGYGKEEFKKILCQICDDEHAFLFINKRADQGERYRRNFDDILVFEKRY